MSNDQITPTVDAANSRRWFLGAAAAVTAGGVLAACGSNDDPVATDTTATTGTAGSTATTAPGGGAAGDLKVAQLAAGLEVLAVATYKGAIDAVKANKLPNVPAVTEFATTAMSQHQTALEAWNKVLTGAGQQAVSSPPAALKKVVDEKFAAVKDIAGVAELALLLENTAADTYLSANKTLTGKDALTMAGALQIVDQEHAAILLFVQGKYPVPEVFQKTDNAFKG